MDHQRTVQLAQAALAFLGRCDLKGAEASTHVAVNAWLTSVLQAAQEAMREAKSEALSEAS